MARVIVFGATGLLGSALCPYLIKLGHEVISAGRAVDLDYCVDMFNVYSLRDLFERVKPTHSVNLVAATNVDYCEMESYAALRLNTLIPGVISTAAATCSSKNIHLIQVSTDQVYDGTGCHTEQNVGPVNVYGLSKLAGELMTSGELSTVLRTNFFGRSMLDSRPSFSDWIVNSLLDSIEVTFFKDLRFSALHITSLCFFIEQVINSKIIGVYNVGCRNGISKADFAFELAHRLNLCTTCARVGYSHEVKNRARRPIDLTMSVSKFEAALGIQCPDMQEEITKTVAEYQND